MKYLVAALCLGAFCALWALLQRGSGRLGHLPCGDDEPDCAEDCSQRDAGCPPADAGALPRRQGSARPAR